MPCRKRSDATGRCIDKVFVEHLRRSVKYEEVDVKAYNSVGATRESLGEYFMFYNSA
jgi:putative transposase